MMPGLFVSNKSIREAEHLPGTKVTAIGFMAALAALVFYVFGGVCQASESLVMNLKPQGSSAGQENTPFVYYLPPELSKEDVLDPGGMQVRYDDKRSTLFLYAEAAPGSPQAKSYRVVVKDIWQIPQTEIDFLKSQTKSRVQYLEGTDDQPAGQKLADHILKELATIEASQAEEVTIPERIELHRVSAEKVTEIRRQVTVMTDFVKQARWLKDLTETTETVKMAIQIKNPTDEPLDRQKVIRYLPRGVAPNDVIDPQGFAVKFDPERRMYYLYKELDLKASETVSSTITFKNAWKIPVDKLDNLVKSAQGYQTRLTGSQYEETGKKILSELENLAAQVKELQAKAENPADMIANFSLNLTRYNAIEDAEKKLKQLVQEIEHPVPQTIPYQIKPATPDVSTTWRIIYGFIGFLTVLGLMFYGLWWGQSKARLTRKYDSHKA